MPNRGDTASGLGPTPRREWPRLTTAQARIPVIDRVLPGSDTHKRVLAYLLSRLKMSEEKMRRFYNRWSYNEARAQAYIDLPDYEAYLKRLNDQSAPPSPVNITVPYIFATNATISTYLLHTFTGRKPIFQVGSYGKNSIEPAKNMEIVLQWNADSVKLISTLWQFFNDISLYGVGAVKCLWKKQTGLRTVWTQKPGILGEGKIRERQRKITFEGNDIGPIDPFMFFPDPRVPMTEVNTKGEFAFWRAFIGVHDLKKEEQQGRVKYITTAKHTSKTGDMADPTSSRDLLSLGEAHPGRDFTHEHNTMDYLQIDQGTIWLVPRELGIGESEFPVLYICSIANKAQIIQLEPLDVDHEMHPVAVAEPFTMGYGFGQPSTTDMLAPIQDIVSWYINSRIDNVRVALNNMFLYDPSMIEEQDLKRPGAGKLIRLKKAAYGVDVRTVLQQLKVEDVTGTHVQDIELLMRMGDALSSISDNLRGIQDAGGRKTATEVRTSGEAAASRLAAEARVISTQAVVDLTKMMSLNVQQFMTMDFYSQLVGADGNRIEHHIAPEHLVGDFQFPIHDGTLPLDRVAMLDIWKEILLGVAQDPQLRSEFSVPRIFEWVAELGGARNIESFRVNLQPDEQVAAAAANGAIPLGNQRQVPIPTGGSPAAIPGGQVTPATAA